jgi:hypothetical protein
VIKLILYALGAVAYIVWAARRLFVAWHAGYVTEVDDPMFGFETARMSRIERPKTYWLGVAITSLLMVAALVFLYFVAAEILQAH